MLPCSRVHNFWWDGRQLRPYTDNSPCRTPGIWNQCTPETDIFQLIGIYMICFCFNISEFSYPLDQTRWNLPSISFFMFIINWNMISRKWTTLNTVAQMVACISKSVYLEYICWSTNLGLYSTHLICLFNRLRVCLSVCLCTLIYWRIPAVIPVQTQLPVSSSILLYFSHFINMLVICITAWTY